MQESRERVRAAVRNSGFAYPLKRITVNLAPADLRKEGPAYDLPMAVGLLLASEQLAADLSRALIIGELSLDDIVRHSNGVLPMTQATRRANVGSLACVNSPSDVDEFIHINLWRQLHSLDK